MWHSEALIVQVLGDEGKVNAAVKMFEQFGILEMVRTGRIAMIRGTETDQAARNLRLAAGAAAIRAMLGRRPEGALPFASD